MEPIDPERRGLALDHSVDGLLGANGRVLCVEYRRRHCCQIGSASLGSPADRIAGGMSTTTGLGHNVAYVSSEPLDRPTFRTRVRQQAVVHGAGESPAKAPAELPSSASLFEALRAEA